MYKKFLEKHDNFFINSLQKLSYFSFSNHLIREEKFIVLLNRKIENTKITNNT